MKKQSKFVKWKTFLLKKFFYKTIQSQGKIYWYFLKNLVEFKIGVIGLYRNEETLKPVKYYYKVPKDIANRTVILLDPMLATGGSAIDAISMLKEDGVENIKFLCIIAAPEGIKKLQETYLDVEVYCAKIDEKLNENGYILPGFGDAGDRIFGTK